MATKINSLGEMLRNVEVEEASVPPSNGRGPEEYAPKPKLTLEQVNDAKSNHPVNPAVVDFFKKNGEDIAAALVLQAEELEKLAKEYRAAAEEAIKNGEEAAEDARIHIERLKSIRDSLSAR